MIDFSALETQDSKFTAILSETGGYITFSNSSRGSDKKYFTLGLNSFLQCLKDILKNRSSFLGKERYVEKKWRDLGKTYYTDNVANTMCTVQTKAIFTTISKLILWANSLSLSKINPEEEILFDIDKLEKTIVKLTNIIERYTPINEVVISKQEIVSEKIKTFKVLRHFAKYLFEYFYDLDKIILESTFKTRKIDNLNYIGHDFCNFTNIIAQFDDEKTQDELKSSGTNRFIAEPLNINDKRFYYFSSQWYGKGNYKLLFDNLKIHFEEKFPNYRVERSYNGDEDKNTEYWLEKIIIKHENFNYKAFQKSTKDAGINFSEILTTRFISSLCSKPFVLLTGLSGSGKTKLAQCFSHWICEDESQFRIVPVGADWTNREPLLGFPNVLNSEEYVKPENGVLDLLIEATKAENFQKPYFLILDEMNLSHVERYFADFLSSMESNDYISLHSGDEKIIKVPKKIYLPSNLFIIGTVNIDETTYMFSPKVLDRANVIEFRLDENDISDYLKEPTIPNLALLEGKGMNMAADFLKISTLTSNGKTNKKINDTLLVFFKELKKSGAEFGYRTASEIYRLITQLGLINDKLSDNEKLDIAIMQKLLPKVHGSRRKLEPVFETLASFCIDGNIKDVLEFFDRKVENDYKGSNKVKFPLSLEKIVRMYNEADDNGFASYSEA